MYKDADVYILDDPLSAVDAHTGQHIMDHVILGRVSTHAIYAIYLPVPWFTRC